MDQFVKSDECPGPADPRAAVDQETPGVVSEDLLGGLVEVQQRHRILGRLHFGPRRALELLNPPHLV